MRAGSSSSLAYGRTAVLGLVLSCLLLALLPSAAGAASRVTTSACPAAVVPDAGLRDVPSGSTHAAAVECLLWWGITRGAASGGYEPAGAMTRGQMASFLARLLDRTSNVLPETAPDRFSDDDGSTHEASINRLAQAGITTGRADGGFGPSDPVSRAQMASFLARTAGSILPQELAAGRDAFVDDNGSPHEAGINAVAEAGIAAGMAEGRYDPGSAVRRDQMASFLARTADLVVGGRFGLLSVTVAGLPTGAVPVITGLSPTAGTRRSTGPGVLAVPPGSWAVMGGGLDVAGDSWAAVQSPSLSVSGGQVTPADLLYTSAGKDRVADDVEALTGQDAQAVTAYDPRSGEVRLAAAAAARVQPGEVLVAEPSVAAPDGVLARVTERDASPDGEVVLTVAPATLVDVYPDGTEAPLEVQPDSITFVPEEGVTVTNGGDRQGQAAGDRSAQAAEVEVRGPTVRLEVDARVGLSEPIGDLDPASPWSAERGVFVAVKGPVAVTPVAQVQVGLREAAVGIEARTSASLEVGIGAALGTQGRLEPAFRKELGTIRATGCQSFVCATLEGKVVVVVSASGELRYDVRLDTAGRVLGGVRVDGAGQRPWTERESILSVSPIGAAGAGGVEAFVGPELALELYGVVGPFLAGGVYVNSAMAVYSDARPPTCSYEGGVRLTYGVRAEVKILGRGIEASRERQHDWPLRQGACDLTDGERPPTLPPLTLGLGGSLGDLPLLAPEDEAVAYVRAWLGAPTHENPNSTCDGGVGLPGRTVIWGPLRLMIRDDLSDYDEVLGLGQVQGPALVGWEYHTVNSPDSLGLRTEEGVGLGSSSAQVRTAYPDGAPFEDLGFQTWEVFRGDLSNLVFVLRDDVVVAMWSGAPCPE